MRLTAGYQIALVCAVITGCSSHPDNATPGRTIADLADANLPAIGREVPELPIGQVVDNYLEVLEVAEDARVRRQVNTRLADLEMTRSEEVLIDGTADTATGLFAAPISMYEDLIEEPAEDQDTERLLYQLSKAYALDGQSDQSNAALNRLLNEYPDSKFAAEAEFRLAERAFSEGDYERSKTHYSAVVALGEETDYYQNALYMLGWSEFKLNRYQPALTSFIAVLDLLVDQNEDLEGLTNTQRNLAEDTLRVSSIAFSYLGGAQSIQETTTVLGERTYSALLYQNLGTLYESQERYRDAADTYLAFVDEQPYSDKAPDFSILALETYYDGNFPSLILPAKEDFITNYGIRSNYWTLKDTAIQAKLKPYLREYLQELASFNHALAQDTEIELDPQERIDAYLSAASFYDEFILTFPSDAEAPKSAFLMGEAYFAASAYAEATDAYEKVAYGYADEEYGADAGYNAILAIDATMTGLTEPGLSLWRARKIESSIRYADSYLLDDRAAGVLAQAGDMLFESGQLERAIEVSTRITGWVPTPGYELMRNAWLIIGHGQFDLNQFIEAEVAYRELLAILPPEDALTPEIEERIAASLYRQSEQLAADGMLAEAIDKLLSVRDSSPGSEIAITAHFDAINYLMELEDWNSASLELESFMRSHPTHLLADQIPAKQALVYQQLEQWEPAADALLAMIEQETDPEIRRQSLYLAAELLTKAGNDSRAENILERYVTTYPQPLDLAMEAYYQLAELNKGDLITRNRWLNTILNRADSANNRGRYLGAWAASDLADQEYGKFAALKLTLPLRTSLQAKQGSLQTTLEAYNRVLAFGVAEFTTQASFRIGEIYAELSRAMMDSERPADLDVLALEQYEILLEEQAYPFEEKAIEVHEANIQRSWTGDYDDWVKDSFSALAKLLPGRYNKVESRAEVSRGIH